MSSDNTATVTFGIEEYKIWKGIDPNKPLWHGLNIVSSDYLELEGTLKYLSKNKPEGIYRIAISSINANWYPNDLVVSEVYEHVDGSKVTFTGFKTDEDGNIRAWFNCDLLAVGVITHHAGRAFSGWNPVELNKFLKPKKVKL